jgi:hypothetical protein
VRCTRSISLLRALAPSREQARNAAIQSAGHKCKTTSPPSASDSTRVPGSRCARTLAPRSHCAGISGAIALRYVPSNSRTWSTAAAVNVKPSTALESCKTTSFRPFGSSTRDHADGNRAGVSRFTIGERVLRPMRGGPSTLSLACAVGCARTKSSHLCKSNRVSV